MPQVNSPASASPSMLAGMNPPTPAGGDENANASGRVPGAGAGSPDQADGSAVAPAGAREKKDVDALRSIEAQLQELARSYPTATKALRAASEAIMSARRQIISNPGQAEPTVPNTFA